MVSRYAGRSFWGTGGVRGLERELCVLVRACASENEDLVSSVTLGLKRHKSQWKNLRREVLVGQWYQAMLRQGKQVLLFYWMMLWLEKAVCAE